MATTLETLQVELTLNREEFTKQLSIVSTQLGEISGATQSTAGAMGGSLVAGVTKANIATAIIMASFKALGKVLKQVWEVAKKVGGVLFELGKKLMVAGGELVRLRVATNTLARNAGLSAEKIDDLRKNLAGANTYGIKAEQVISSLVRTGLLPMAEGLDGVNKRLEFFDSRTGKTAYGVNALVLAMKDLGASGGMSSGEAIQSITSFISGDESGNARSILAIGDLGYEYAKYADSLNKGADAITAAEKAQVRMNIVMREGEKAIGSYANAYATSGKMLSSITDATSSLISELGASLEPLWASITTGVLNFVQSIRNFLVDNADTFRKWAIKVGAWVMVVWRVLGGLLQRLPIIGSYFKSLSNISLKNAVALKDTADGAEEAEGSLTGAAGGARDLKKELLGLQGFDEMNVLKEPDKGSGGGGSAMDVPSIDGSDLMAGVKEAIDQELDDLTQRFWDFVNPIKDKLEEIWEPIYMVYEDWVKPALDGLKAQLAEIFGGGEGIEWGEALVAILKVVGVAFMLLLGGVLYVINAMVASGIFFWEFFKLGFYVIVDAIALVINFFRDLEKNWKLAVTNLIKGLVDLAKRFVEKFADTKGVIFAFFKAIGEKVASWVMDLVKKVVGLAYKIQYEFRVLKATIIFYWEVIQNEIRKKIQSVKDFVTNFKNNFISNFYYIKNKVVGIITSLVQRVKDKLNGLKTGFINLANNIVGAVKAPLNRIIDRINYFIDKARSINLLGKTPFSGLPRMPRLATGGIVSGPTTALIGEAGREAVLPLDRNTGWMDELASKIGGRGGEQIHLTVQVGDEKIAEHVIDYINDKSFRSQANLATI